MLEDWDMLDVDEDEKLTGEEEFELLAGRLGLNDRRIVPEPVQFPDSDPLGASVAMVTATNSMEETLMQIGMFVCRSSHLTSFSVSFDHIVVTRFVGWASRQMEVFLRWLSG